ncbi:MAG: D-arabinono-1,4-lactone oxidase [Polyangiales bacterium]
MSAIVERDADGCYHPTSEDELVALVKEAYDKGRQIRVLGSSHSVWKAIVTDSFAGPVTPADEMQVVLDRYTTIGVPVDDPAVPGTKRVEVAAGCHLGLSPHRPVQGRIAPGGPAEQDVLRASPWHDASWETSLNYKLHHEYGLAFSDLGGITHQTVSGFISTGSSGGTTKWSVHDGIVALRVIDGQGNVKTLERGGPDEDWFRAAGIGMGLCGILSTVTFRCEPRYDIVGTETISATSKSDCVDFYGDRPGSGLPDLEAFLLETDYTRLMWWPQYDFDRLVVWQAKRQPYDEKMPIRPYKEIATFPVLSQIAASVVYTILGNIDYPEQIVEQLRAIRGHAAVREAGPAFGEKLRGQLGAPPPDPDFALEPQELFPWLSALIERLAKERHDPITLGAAWVAVVELLVTIADDLLEKVLANPVVKKLFSLLGKWVPEHIGQILGLFVTSGKDGAPVTQHFQDRWFLGLPMDNQMDDLLMPTWFTEIWIPFTPGDGTVQKVIDRLRLLFSGGGDPYKAYAATGAFSFELYAAKKDETFYLSPATGSNVFRVDVFWWAKNQGNPVTDFYPQFWEALDEFGYRLHWGKFLPSPDAIPPSTLTSRYPGFEDWKKVRERVDPKGIFLTDYWKSQLGLG